MSQKQVAGWLKGITLSIAGMGLLFFGLVVPYLAWDMAVTYPDYAALRIPGILYGWGIAVFCYAILYQFWKVCVQIGRDNSFSDNSVTLIFRFASMTSILILIAILFLAAKRALGPAFLIFMILLIFINVVIAVLAAALSHLIYKSYEMKQDAELTI